MTTVNLLLGPGGDIEKGQLLDYAVVRDSSDVFAVIDMLLKKGARIDEKKYDNDQWS